MRLGTEIFWDFLWLKSSGPGEKAPRQNLVGQGPQAEICHSSHGKGSLGMRRVLQVKGWDCAKWHRRLVVASLPLGRACKWGSRESCVHRNDWKWNHNCPLIFLWRICWQPSSSPDCPRKRYVPPRTSLLGISLCPCLSQSIREWLAFPISGEGTTLEEEGKQACLLLRNWEGHRAPSSCVFSCTGIHVQLPSKRRGADSEVAISLQTMSSIFCFLVLWPQLMHVQHVLIYYDFLPLSPIPGPFWYEEPTPHTPTAITCSSMPSLTWWTLWNHELNRIFIPLLLLDTLVKGTGKVTNTVSRRDLIA